jgi:hypothetical protein
MADRREELRTIGASAVMVRLAGAVPSRSADTIRGERNASGASSRMWRSTFASRRAIAAKLAARPCAKSSMKGLTAAGFDRRPIGRVSVGLWRPWRRRQIQSLCSFFRQFSVSRRLLQQIRLKRGILFCNGHFFKVDGPFEILRNQFHRRALWTQDEFGLSPFSPNHVCLAASKCKEFNHAPRPGRGAAPPRCDYR